SRRDAAAVTDREQRLREDEVTMEGVLH
ncbi:hypothetical protein A2U01_0003704, partial [Trifolium medium]|nr:hypothetical protein [Trifolium medium]